MGDRDNNFDLIRLYAALEVLYVHAVVWLNLPQASGFRMLMDAFPGVAVFFVISGFLVTDSLLRNDGHIGRFWLSRALRIYPALWVNIIIIDLMLMADGALTNGFGFSSYSLAQFVVGSDSLATWLVGWGNIHPHVLLAYPSGVLWTLSVELGFYVFVAVLLRRSVRGVRSRANTAMVVAFVLSLIFSFYLGGLRADVSSTFTLLWNTPPAYFWIFLLGAAGRVNWAQVRCLFEHKFPVWLAAYLAVYMFCADRSHAQLDFHHTDAYVVLKMALMAGCVLSFAHSWRGLARFLRGNDLSYGIYLFHMQVVVLLKSFGFTHKPYLWLVVLGSTVLVASLSWVLVEKPSLSLKRRFRVLAAAPAE